MGRHTITSSPWRSPAVLVGVPVATVLATCCSTAVLGSVIPSAEELPLRGQGAVSDTVVPGSTEPVSTAPVVTDAASDGLDLTADGANASRAGDTVDTARDLGRSAGQDAVGPRVVRVADEPTAPVRTASRAAARTSLDAAAPARDTARPVTVSDSSVSAVPERASLSRRASGADTEPERAPVAAVSSRGDQLPSAGAPVSARTLSSESDTSDDDGDRDRSVVGLDAPTGALSVLSFG